MKRCQLNRAACRVRSGCHLEPVAIFLMTLVGEAPGPWSPEMIKDLRLANLDKISCTFVLLFHARGDFEIILMLHRGLLHFHVMPVDAPVGSQGAVLGGLQPPQQQWWIIGIIQVFSKMFWMIFCCSHFQQVFLNVVTICFFSSLCFSSL